MTTTAARSRDFMRKQGYTAECVEHRKGRFIRVDLFNFADVIAYKPGEGIILIQAYFAGAREKRVHADIMPEKNMDIKRWLQAGGKFEHHLWHCTQKKGRKHWSVEVKNITLPTLNFNNVGLTSG